MSGEKTEPPTDKRIADARARGDVARSRDLVAFATLGAAYGAFVLGAPAGVGRLRAGVAAAIHAARDPDRVDPGHLLVRAAHDLALVTAPVLLAMSFVGVAVAFLDAGPVLALARALPKLSRLDPAAGFTQLFSRDRFVELAKSVVVLVALIVVAGVTLADAAPFLVRLGEHAAPRGLPALGVLVGRLLARSLVVLAALAAFDFVLSRRQHQRSLRMTKDEVKREWKEASGDPHQKGERARMHREILEHSVLESVRRADVLVVNPTHLAIALAFDPASDQAAPEVVAKGEDALAKRMIDAAREAGVPVMRDIPLARSLYDLELGDEIPELLFEAVAAVLTAAWDERGTRDGAGTPGGDAP